MLDKKDKKTDSNESLDQFNIEINEFGQIITNTKIEEINEFLNDNVEDKKLTETTEEEQINQDAANEILLNRF